MKKHIICLGDSNTHGYCADPSDCADPALARFNESERWTCLLQKALGDEYLVIEEGLSGRTTVFQDPLYEGLDALHYLYPCLKSHEPVSLLIIMLGTNDTKERFGVNPFAIGLGMRRLVQKAKTVDCWGPNGTPNILVVAPPVIGEGVLTSGVAEEMGTMGPSCVEKSRKVPGEFRRIAAETGVHFLDANEVGCKFNEVDFMHLTKTSHARLAEALAALVPELL
nr:GDSL-type esterase/lipase family protein [uncultured Dysosmobacter sp.]